MTNKFINKKRSAPSSAIKAPNWGSLFFGILIGIFIASLVVFMFSTSDITLKIPTGRSKNQPVSDMLASAAQTSALAAAQPAAEPPIAVQEPRFDFYTELAKSPEQASDLKSAPKTINGYLVQAGLFRKVTDADALKAKLTLNGYAAKIEPVKLRDGELWQRIMLGPYKTEQRAKVLQQKLKALDIDSVLVLKYAD